MIIFKVAMYHINLYIIILIFTKVLSWRFLKLYSYQILIFTYHFKYDLMLTCIAISVFKKNILIQDYYFLEQKSRFKKNFLSKRCLQKIMQTSTTTK